MDIIAREMNTIIFLLCSRVMGYFDSQFILFFFVAKRIAKNTCWRDGDKVNVGKQKSKIK